MNSFSYSCSCSLPYTAGSSAILPSSEFVNPTSIEATLTSNSFPGARFKGTLVDARFNWSFTAAFTGVSASSRVLQRTNSRLARYTRNFSWSNLGVMRAEGSRNGEHE